MNALLVAAVPLLQWNNRSQPAEDHAADQIRASAVTSETTLHELQKPGHHVCHSGIS